jgi:hypothetical protein
MILCREVCALPYQLGPDSWLALRQWTNDRRSDSHGSERLVDLDVYKRECRLWHCAPASVRLTAEFPIAADMWRFQSVKTAIRHDTCLSGQLCRHQAGWVGRARYPVSWRAFGICSCWSECEGYRQILLLGTEEDPSALAADVPQEFGYK